MKVIVERYDSPEEVIENAYSTIIRDGVLIVSVNYGGKHGFPLGSVAKWEEWSDYDGPEA